jgi:hypothetical protein
MRRKIILGSIILCLIGAALLMPGMVSAADTISDTATIYNGGYEDEMLFGLGTNERIDISVDVTSPAGASVDVYIIASTEKYDYPSESFTPVVAHEGVSNADFSFKSPDSQTYYLVIDNTDNSRSSDAVPTGDVTVNYEYDDPLSAIIESFENTAEAAFWTGTLICATVVIAIVVVIVLIVWLIVRAGKSSPPPQQPYPPQQYPQQPYPQQPYPQQQYAPPPGEQPPVEPQEQPPEQPPGDQGYYPPPPNQEGAWPPQQPNQPPPEE